MPQGYVICDLGSCDIISRDLLIEGPWRSRDPRSDDQYQYQYVRQWSVDVAALADQLENPKAYLTTSGVTLASRQQVCTASTDNNTGTMPMIFYSVKANIHYTSFSVASPQQVHNIKDMSVTSCRGQKSVASVVSCRFPNFITTTCCRLVVCVANESVTSWQLPHLQGNYGETCVMDFGN